MSDHPKFALFQNSFLWTHLSHCVCKFATVWGFETLYLDNLFFSLFFFRRIGTEENKVEEREDEGEETAVAQQ